MKNFGVIITGAASGIGKGIAQKFVEMGSNVLLFDLNGACLIELKSALEKFSKAKVEIFEGDVAKESDWLEALNIANSAFESLDCIINNAGIGITKPVEELTLQECHSVLDIDVTSIFLSAKYGAKFLRASGGSMINISSTRAGMSESNTEAYSAAKGAVVSLTHALAMSLAPVRVNCISPGWIDNGSNSPVSKEDHEQHPVGRAGVPKDIAELAYFLADSQKSGFISAQNFVCDGGMTKKMIYV